MNIDNSLHNNQLNKIQCTFGLIVFGGHVSYIYVTTYMHVRPLQPHTRSVQTKCHGDQLHDMHSAFDFTGMHRIRQAQSYILM